MRANSMAWGMQQHPGQLSLQETQGQQTIFNAIIPQHRGFRADFSDEKQIYSTVRSLTNDLVDPIPRAFIESGEGRQDHSVELNREIAVRAPGPQ